MKKRLGMVALVLVVLMAMFSVVIGCSNEIETPRFGSLTLSTDGRLSRTIQPSGELIAVAKYKVSGSGPSSATFTPVESATSPITVDGLIEGSWSITVEGLNSSGTTIATKTLTVVIVSGQKTDATFSLQWLEGFGNLNVTVTWPASVTSFTRIHGNLSQGITEIETFDLLVADAAISGTTDKTITQNFVGLATGSYDFMLTFHDGNGSLVGLPYMDQVNIYDGMASTGTCVIPEVLLPIETPVISPAGGRIVIGQLISITSASANVTIHYTTDGTNPTSSSEVYKDPFVLEKNSTVKAVALDPARFASSMVSATFEVPAASPTFTVSGGTYDSPRMVSMASTTGGVVIHYTLNGEDPTEASATYSSALAINENTTVKAIALHADYGDSEIASAEYLIRVGAPQFSLDDSISHRGTQPLTLTSATSGATILYTLNGDDPATAGVAYDTEAGISLSTSTVVKAVSRKANMVDSAVITKSYLIPPTAATPTIVPESGTYASKQTVTITTTEPDGAIYYTIDGTTPTADSIPYSVPFDVEVNTIVKAVTVKAGYWDSDVAQKSYQIQAAAPEFSPVAGSYNGAQTVAITSATWGAMFRYTTDGSNPTNTSQAYISPISVPYTTTIKAYSSKAGMADSAVVTGEFLILGSSGLVIQNPTHYSVSIQLPAGWEGATVASNAGGTATAVVTPAPAEGEVTYTWYLDGVEAKNNGNQIASIGSTIRFGIGADEILLGAGPHLLVVKVTKGSMTYSDQKLISAALPQTPYTITFDAQGGSNPSPTSMTVIDGSAYGTLAVSTRPGFTLTGWFTGPKGTGTEITAQSIVDLDADQTLYASWTPTDGYISVRLTSTTDPSDVRETILASGVYGDGSDYNFFDGMPGIPFAVQATSSSQNINLTLIVATADPIKAEDVPGSSIINLYVPINSNGTESAFAECNIPEFFPDYENIYYRGDGDTPPELEYTITRYDEVGGYVIGTGIMNDVPFYGVPNDGTSEHVSLGNYKVEFEFRVKRIEGIHFYQLKYDMNGGIGGDVRLSEDMMAGGITRLPTNEDGISEKGYPFEGWNTQSDGGGISYSGGELFTMPDHDVTLYALWRERYSVGNIGPSGGYVFYDKGRYSDGWRYLEAAPSDIMLGVSEYRHIFGYYRVFPDGSTEPVGTATGIGTGKSNTAALIGAMGNAAYISSVPTVTTTTDEYAARLCDMYEAGGHDDWFLPSLDELNQMYQNLYLNNLGGLSGSIYWSSSKSSPFNVWIQNLNDGVQDSRGSANEYRVRPVRAF